MLKMAVLVSGGGTNLQAIIDSITNGTITNAEISVVISNNANAYALERARKHGIEARCISPKQYETREAFNEALLAAIQSYGPHRDVGHRRGEEHRLEDGAKKGK